MPRPSKTDIRLNSNWFKLDDIQGEMKNEDFLYETLIYLNRALEIPKEEIIAMLDKYDIYKDSTNMESLNNYTIGRSGIYDPKTSTFVRLDP